MVHIGNDKPAPSVRFEVTFPIRVHPRTTRAKSAVMRHIRDPRMAPSCRRLADD